MTPQVMTKAEVSPYLTYFESLRAGRIDYDRKWQLVSDYILPRRDFSIIQRPGQLRPHRVTSSVATNANARMAALLLSYWFDPSRPFLTPNAKSGLIAAGRDTNLQPDALDYLAKLEWSLFDRLMLPGAQLAMRANSMLKEFCAFGCGVLWTGRRRGFGPYFNTRPLSACWWSENEEGEIDTLYYRMQLPVYRVLQRWPAAATLTGWNTLSDAARNSEQTLTPILMACRPRAGGVYGAVVEAKPFAMVVIAEEKKAILEETGYDSFPYSVFRYDPRPGEAYAEGPGCQVLPDVMVLNHLQQAIENAAEQKAEPPLAYPARMFGAPLDRRRGAVNHYNPAGLGLNRADQAILKLDFTGNIDDAVAIKKTLIEDIELGYFVDWLRLRESGDMTAEEVGERRDMRLRGTSSIVAGFEYPTTRLGDRAMEIMIEEGLVAPPPGSLAGVNVDWEYSGPLAIAQLSGNVRSIMQLLNAQAIIAKTDPASADAVDLEESLRALAEGMGTPTRVLKSRAEVAQTRATLAKQQEQARQAQLVAQTAQAVRDGTQGAQAAAGAASAANDMAQPGAGAPSPFAPANPFATPAAA